MAYVDFEPQGSGEFLLLFRTHLTIGFSFIFNKFWGYNSMNLCHVSTNSMNYGHAFQFSKGNSLGQFYISKDGNFTSIYVKGEKETPWGNGTCLLVPNIFGVEVVLQKSSLPSDAIAFTSIS